MRRPTLGTVARRPPADVVARAGLPRGERTLASAVTDDGTWLLGTRLALHVVEAQQSRRIGWAEVESAGWDAETSVLEVAEVGEWGGARPVHRFGLAEPGRLLELLRERVSASVLLQRRILVADRSGFNLQARRDPGDGSVRWVVEYDEDVDRDDPIVRAAVDVALGEARADVEP